MANNSIQFGRVAVVGTLNMDLVWQVPALPRPGQTILATAAERQFGGKGANQAVAAARLGAKVTMVGAVGDDTDGAHYRNHLAEEGIDVSQLSLTRRVPTGAAHVYVDPVGENLIVVDRGANADLRLTGFERVLATTDVLLVQLECATLIALQALRLGEKRGVRTILNASPTDGGFPWGEQAIDVVIVNEHECRESFGRVPAEMWELPIAERGALLANRKVRHLVVTQGALPTLHFSAEERQAIPAYPVTPRDTVGAGDTFAGALAAGMATFDRWESALWRANVAAALSTLEIGAQSAIPRRAVVEDAMTRFATAATVANQ